MKKLYWMFALVVAGAGCQQQAPPTRTTTSEASKKALPAASAASNVPLKHLDQNADTLTAPMLALLREYDLAPLWGNTNRADSTSDGNPVLDGFLGPDHYRTSLALTQIWRDSLNPALFHVLGKSRYKRSITPFSGVVEVKRVADLKSYLDLAPEDSMAQAYTAESHFVLREAPTAKGAGVFEGTGLLDFYVTPKGVLGQVLLMGGEDNPARGQGVILKGQWTSNQTKERKELLLARDVFRIAPDVLKNFGIGDRGGEINPKYAKLGWDQYWENEEWWADSPTARL